MKLHFIRHGESTGNLIRQLQSVLDTELTANGYEQAMQLRGKLDVALVYHSPLRRAAETARVAFEDIDQTEIIELPDLREHNIGVLVGKIYPELTKNELSMFEKMKADPEYVIEGGESYNQFALRIAGVMEKIQNDMLQRDKLEAVVVTHGEFLRVFFDRQVGISDLTPGNTTIHSVEMDNGKWKCSERITSDSR